MNNTKLLFLQQNIIYLSYSLIFIYLLFNKIVYIPLFISS